MMTHNTHPNAPLKEGVTNSFVLTALVPLEIVSKYDASRKKVSIINDSDIDILINLFNVCTPEDYTLALPARSAQSLPSALFENASIQAYVGIASAWSPTDFAVGVGAQGSILFTGTGGSMTSLTIGGVEILTETIVNATSGTVGMAVQVADHINAGASGYTAIASDSGGEGLITITAPTGTLYNGLVIAIATTPMLAEDVILDMGTVVAGVNGESIKVTEYRS